MAREANRDPNLSPRASGCRPTDVQPTPHASNITSTRYGCSSASGLNYCVILNLNNEYLGFLTILSIGLDTVINLELVLVMLKAYWKALSVMLMWDA